MQIKFKKQFTIFDEIKERYYATYRGEASMVKDIADANVYETEEAALIDLETDHFIHSVADEISIFSVKPFFTKTEEEIEKPERKKRTIFGLSSLPDVTRIPRTETGED